MRGARVLPPRMSEVVGVAHIKAYAFDNSVLLSGANLSNTYFSMRQDRYYVFHDAPGLAAHIRSIVQARGMQQSPSLMWAVCMRKPSELMPTGIITMPCLSSAACGRKCLVLESGETEMLQYCTQSV